MFFLLPVAVDYRARRYPVVTFTLLGINAVLYLLSLAFFFSNPSESDPLVSHLGLIPEEKVWWTWLTCIFVHGGFLHFAGNMVYLYLFAACVEDLMGRWQFSLFYLGGGLLASLAQVVLTKSAEADLPIVGASGAISACIGAFLVALPHTRINFKYFGWILRPFSGEFWIKAWIVIVFWFILDFGSLVLDLWGDATGGEVAFGAHVGGTIVGVLAMLPFRKRLLLADDEGEPVALVNRPEPRVGSSRTMEESPTVFLFINGEQMGPYTESTVRRMISLGSISDETQFWREGMAEWRPVAEL